MKLFLTSLFLLGIIISYGQDFPGDSVSLLNGKELRVIPYLYSYFYKDEQLNKKIDDNVTMNEQGLPKTGNLFNKVFKIIKIDKYVDVLDNDMYKLKLDNSETGIIYFNYNPKEQSWFPFEVIGGIKYPEGFFCNDILVSIDKFTKDTTYYTTSSEGISISRVKNSNKNNIYLSIKTPGASLNVSSKGLIVLLDNNLKIERPDENIDAKCCMGSYYAYSTTIKLTESEINLLSKNMITDTRLYIYDKSIRYGKKIVEYLKCIITK